MVVTGTVRFATHPPIEKRIARVAPHLLEQQVLDSLIEGTVEDVS